MARRLTRGGLFDQTMGRVRQQNTDPRGAFAWDMWRRDVTRNPEFMQATADDEALAYAQQENQLAHDLLMQENAKRSRGNVDLLKRAVNNPNGANLFSVPTNPEEAQLQRIIQGHVNAGARGFTAGFNQDAANQKARLAAMLKLRDLENDRAKLQYQQFNENRDFRRQSANDKFSQDYRKDLLAQSKAQDTARAAAQNRTATERGLQDDLDMAFEMVRDFGMDPEEAIRVFKVPEGSATEVLRSVGGMVSDRRNVEQGQVQNFADILNQIEISKRRSMADPYMNPAALDRGALPPLSNADLEQLLGSAGKEGIGYDRTRGFFLPPPPMKGAPSTPSRRTAMENMVSAAQSGLMQRVREASRRTGYPIALTRAEIMRLDEGTKFIGPDGLEHTRR